MNITTEVDTLKSILKQKKDELREITDKLSVMEDQDRLIAKEKTEVLKRKAKAGSEAKFAYYTKEAENTKRTSELKTIPIVKEIERLQNMLESLSKGDDVEKEIEALREVYEQKVQELWRAFEQKKESLLRNQGRQNQKQISEIEQRIQKLESKKEVLETTLEAKLNNYYAPIIDSISDVVPEQEPVHTRPYYKLLSQKSEVETSIKMCEQNIRVLEGVPAKESTVSEEVRQRMKAIDEKLAQETREREKKWEVNEAELRMQREQARREALQLEHEARIAREQKEIEEYARARAERENEERRAKERQQERELERLAEKQKADEIKRRQQEDEDARTADSDSSSVASEPRSNHSKQQYNIIQRTVVPPKKAVVRKK